MAPDERTRSPSARATSALTLPPGTYVCELDTADGAIDTTGVTCDPTATAIIHVDVEVGDITLVPGPMP